MDTRKLAIGVAAIVGATTFLMSNVGTVSTGGIGVNSLDNTLNSLKQSALSGASSLLSSETSEHSEELGAPSGYTLTTTDDGKFVSVPSDALMGLGAYWNCKNAAEVAQGSGASEEVLRTVVVLCGAR